MKSANALDRDDLAICQEGGGGLDCIAIGRCVFLRSAGVLQPNLWPANGARIGLRVKAPAGRIAILREAGVAHSEGIHARCGSVVRDRMHDGEPRPAMRAIGEGVAIAAVGWVADVGKAGGAGRGIGGDACSDRAGLALNDVEAFAFKACFARGDFYGVDARERRGFRRKSVPESIKCRLLPPSMDENAFAVVQHLAQKPETPCQPPNRRTEPNTLNEPTHPD